ncbi:MAG TPA: DNA-directed RNA polymerase subunit omega [Terriglobia bacterium]|nr:DNA-directed RNA polymerase subunit omega [Terriglobia bacterium]
MDFPQNLDSKFRYILVAAKRARQLQAGARPLIQTQSKKTTRVAQQEVLAGLVPIEIPELETEANGTKKKKE